MIATGNFLFLHLPKTGGSFVTRELLQIFPGAKDFDIEPILRAWELIDSEVDPHGVQFLESRGFTVLMT